MAEPNNTTSARDISSEWNADIYSSLKRLELYERISVDGFPQLIDYVTSLCVDRNPGAVLVRAKTQAISSFISECYTLLQNVRFILSEKNYKDLSLKQKAMEDYVGQQGIYQNQYNPNASRRGIIGVSLTSPYFEAVKLLTSLRGELIGVLTPILIKFKSSESSSTKDR